MKIFRIVYLCLYAYIVPIFCFFSMLLLGDDSQIWERIIAVTSIAVSGCLESGLLHILGRKDTFTCAFQLSITIIDLIMLCSIIAIVTLSLQQSEKIIANWVSGYIIMFLFVVLRVWDYIYIDKNTRNSRL